MSLEGKILLNIPLDNAMQWSGSENVRTWDLRVLHSLLYGEPKLSWRKIGVINIWETSESFNRKMIPYVRLICAMIIKQNHLPEESL
ncbi:hypothetical protein HanHA89_Chr12g0463571 [Helianthus annuus]|nr:hypothetical protein HanHA89_Chr12g0463571 [Helianthus annuus]